MTTPSMVKVTFYPQPHIRLFRRRCIFHFTPSPQHPTTQQTGYNFLEQLTTRRVTKFPMAYQIPQFTFQCVQEQESGPLGYSFLSLSDFNAFNGLAARPVPRSSELISAVCHSFAITLCYIVSMVKNIVIAQLHILHIAQHIVNELNLNELT